MRGKTNTGSTKPRLGRTLHTTELLVTAQPGAIPVLNPEQTSGLMDE